MRYSAVTLLTALLVATLSVVPAGGDTAGEPAAGREDSATVIYLLRHAEAALPPYREDPPDPSLNKAGIERAGQLVHVLGAAGATRIFSSDFKRTRETVQPLARRLGLDIELYNPRALEDFARQLRSMSGRLIVAGHSNTTPALVRLLGGDPGEPIHEATEFDRLYVMILQAGESTATIELRYGRAP